MDKAEFLAFFKDRFTKSCTITTNGDISFYADHITVGDDGIRVFWWDGYGYVPAKISSFGNYIAFEDIKNLK